MRWGIRFALLSTALGLALSGGAAAADEPVYEEAPIYSPAPESGKVRFSGLQLNRNSGTAVVFVRVPGPGRAILHGRGVRRLVRSARQATVVGLPVKPKVRLRLFLKRHGKGHIRVEATFKPTGGTPSTIERPIVLRWKRS
jgi:hypothetical protein